MKQRSEKRLSMARDDSLSDFQTRFSCSGTIALNYAAEDMTMFQSRQVRWKKALLELYSTALPQDSVPHLFSEDSSASGRVLHLLQGTHSSPICRAGTNRAERVTWPIYRVVSVFLVTEANVLLSLGSVCITSGEGQGNPLQYSSLENPHGQRSLAGYSPWGLKKSDTTEQLSLSLSHTHTHTRHTYRM